MSDLVCVCGGGVGVFKCVLRWMKGSLRLLITILHRIHHAVFFNYTLSCRAVFTLSWHVSPHVNSVIANVCLSNLVTFFFHCQNIPALVVVATVWNRTPTLAIFKDCKSVMVCDCHGEKRPFVLFMKSSKLTGNRWGYFLLYVVGVQRRVAVSFPYKIGLIRNELMLHGMPEDRNVWFELQDVALT